MEHCQYPENKIVIYILLHGVSRCEWVNYIKVHNKFDLICCLLYWKKVWYILKGAMALVKFLLIWQQCFMVILFVENWYKAM